ncbi:RAMP superfamily CRISPR-associated protein [Kyrpidia tusciae]|uniref:CRISPR type III-associated protein domain-containing protein n=1 Tax=Kyrpidia tusciae (strain DSM 2912 / NBRC 15312 / T2) TaxID=562970 RepID=D5WRW7_KYRT2|nr:RAMP superfamily CRISPR-associated protein [Kyrpidia tusciae]ADG06919.1 protein of unknown function DUF324 [Kyrpidia tusciae DSM 2912]
MLTLTFEIEWISNYHVGAGHGKGFGVDSALLRDPDRTPILRGSMLAGLLRDGTCRLLQVIPSKKNSTGDVVDRLFGSPAQEKSWRISSAGPTTRFVQDSSTRWRVRIDPRTRRSEPHKLFSQEEGVAGQTFRFTVTSPYSDEVALDEAALLVAAARFVRESGRSRRRGLGECVIHLVDVVGADTGKPRDESWEEWLLKRFERVWLHGEPHGERRTGMTVRHAWPSAEKGREEGKEKREDRTRVRLRMIAYLDEPLLIAQRAAAGNRYDTQTHISGNVILGALATLAARRNNMSDPATYRDFVALFLRGKMRCSMLYPAYYHNDYLYPTIPAPYGLLTCSVVPFRGDDVGHGVFPAWKQEKDRCPVCGSRLEPVGQYVVYHQNVGTLLPERFTEMHIRIDPNSQRVAPGNLYSYSVLGAGQYFLGEIQLSGEKWWHRLQERTGIGETRAFTLWLGKARQRGYGKVTGWLERIDSQPFLWVPWPLDRRVKDPSQPLTLTFLTDAIVTHTWGQQAAGISEEWLNRLLGVEKVVLHEVYARTKVVDGFNAVLGLPRWRDMALAAGTTVVFQLPDPPGDWAARLQRLEDGGIGIRRHEGFGRVAFNHPLFEERLSAEGVIRLQKDMRLRKPSEPDLFHRFWEERLDKAFSPDCFKGQEARLTGLARWLYANRNESPAALAARMNEIGQPASSLVALLGGVEECGERCQLNRFQAELREELEKIGRLLEFLQEKGEGHWRAGIESLAMRIASLVKDNTQGREEAK